jgi:hypothetical protein
MADSYFDFSDPSQDLKDGDRRRNGNAKMGKRTLTGWGKR